MPKFIIPPAFTKFTENKSELFVDAGNIECAIHQLIKEYPKLNSYILINKDNIHPHITLCLNEKKVNYLAEKDTPTHLDDTITLLMPLVGG